MASKHREQLRPGVQPTRLITHSNKMYKTRFKRWKLKKYVSACDKEAVAQLLDVYRRKGLEPPVVELDGKRVPFHIVRRYCRRNRIFNETCNLLPYIPDSATSQIDDSEEPAELWAPPSADGDNDSLMNLSRSPLSMNNLSLTSELDQTQLILTLTSQYFHRHFSGHDISSDHLTRSSSYASRSNVAHHTDPVDYYRQIHRGAISVPVKSFFDQIGQALDLMVADEQQRAWQAVHEACDMVKAAFYDQHRSLLKIIYRTFSDARWVNCRFAGLRSCVFRHVASMSGKVLGPQHLLSKILRLCQNPTVFRYSSYQVFNVISDASTPYVGAYGPEISGLRRAHCETLMMNSEYDTAETETRKHIAELESRIGPNHYDTRRTLLRLAQIYVQQQLYEPALVVYFDEIQRARVELGDAFPDESCLVTYHKIAYVFNECGDIVSAEKYWRLAHEKPVSLWHCPSTTRHFGHHLKDMLSLQANLKRKGLILKCVTRPIAERQWPGTISQPPEAKEQHQWATCSNCE